MPVRLCLPERTPPNLNNGQLWVLLRFGLGDRTAVKELVQEMDRALLECRSEVCQTAVFTRCVFFCSLWRQTPSPLARPCFGWGEAGRL